MHASLEQLISLRDGGLVAAEAAEHVRACTYCRREVTRLERWRQNFRELPGFRAPEDTWQKIVARIDQPERKPHRVRWMPAAGLALAASLVAAVVLVTWSIRAPTPVSRAPSGSPLLVQLQSRSRYLENIVQAMNTDSDQGVTNAGTAATVAALEDRIALIDYAINQANTAPRPSRDLAQLWQQRVNLMQSLAAVRYAQVSAASWDQ